MNLNSNFITIKEAKEKKLTQKLNLTGYVLYNFSILANEIFANLPKFVSNTENEDFPQHLTKEFVENTLSSPVIDFLLKNNYLNESKNMPHTFVITEKSQNIFKLILESEIKL